MTRFARAKGSKASNERVPEEATSWSDMKQQLLEKNKRTEEAKKKKEADKQRQKNYQAFLQDTEEEQSKNVKWAEFPSDSVKKVKKVEKNNNESLSLKVKKTKKETLKITEKSESAKRKSNEEEVVEQPVKKKPKKSKSTSTENQETATNEQGHKETKKTIEKKIEKPITPDKKNPKQQRVKKKSKKPNTAVKKPIDPASLTEEERKKIEKKKQKKIRQLEKRKHYKPGQKPIQRRKNFVEKVMINGQEIELAYVDGFPVKKEDADRLAQLRKQMISKGLPRSEIKAAMKLERRKAEKALAREKKKVCFNCRKSGHNLSECPDLEKQVTEGTGICFKCGSTEHTHFECKVVRGQEFKFAQCFICHEQGHIARQCPDNARGLYPKGGACKVCGDVTHLKKDCPTYQNQQKESEQKIVAETITEGDNPDTLGSNEEPQRVNREQKRPNKIIKFK